MKRYFFFAALGLLCLSMKPAGEGNVPNAMEGMWKGVITKEGDGMYDITFEIMENAVGYRTGIVNYPTQACGGELYLVGPAKDDNGHDGVKMTEKLTRGQETCTAGSEFFFYMDGENMRLNWTVKDHPEMKGTAKLTKHGKGVGSGAGK
jgi:hypothetical protein